MFCRQIRLFRDEGTYLCIDLFKNTIALSWGSYFA
jgi:hypothetical protein